MYIRGIDRRLASWEITRRVYSRIGPVTRTRRNWSRKLESWRSSKMGCKRSVWTRKIHSLHSKGRGYKQYLTRVSAFHIWIQLAQISACFLSPRLSQAIIAHEKVDSQILLCHNRWINNCKSPDTRQHQVFQRLDSDNARCWCAVDVDRTIRIHKQDMRTLEFFLSCGCP